MDIKQKYAEKIKAAREGNVPASPFYDKRLAAHAAPLLSAFDEFVEQLPDKPWWDIHCAWRAMADIGIWVTDRYCANYRIRAHVPNEPLAGDGGFEANLDHPVYCVSRTTGGLFPKDVEQYSFDTLEEAFDCFLREVCESIVEAEKFWAEYPDADKWVPTSREYLDKTEEERRAHADWIAKEETEVETIASQIREHLGTDHGQLGRRLRVRDADIDYKLVEYEHKHTTTWFILKDGRVLKGQYSTYEDARNAALNMEQN